MAFAACRYLALAVLLAAGARGAEPSPAAALAIVTGVTVESAARGVCVRVDLSQPRALALARLDNPDKVYLDIPDGRLHTALPLRQEVRHALVQSVRAGQFQDRPPVARVVLDLPSRQAARLERDNDGRTWFIQLGAGAERPAMPLRPAPRVAVVGSRWSGESGEEATFTVTVGELTQYKLFSLGSPDRLVLDIDGAALRAAAPAPGQANRMVRGLAAGQADADVARFVFDLDSDTAYEISPRLNPSRLELRFVRKRVEAVARGRLVVVDPGHGGHDAGTTGYRAGLFEKNVVLDIGRRTAALLQAKGVRTLMTRSDDTFIPLYERPAIANRAGADLFVSIHCNSMPDSRRGERSGSETYYYTEQSLAFARMMLQEFASVVGLPARHTQRQRFVVVRYTTMPSVLVETGYLDHRGDGSRLEDPEFRQRCALGVVHGVMRWFGENGGGSLASGPAAEPAGAGEVTG